MVVITDDGAFTGVLGLDAWGGSRIEPHGVHGLRAGSSRRYPARVFAFLTIALQARFAGLTQWTAALKNVRPICAVVIAALPTMQHIDVLTVISAGQTRLTNNSLVITILGADLRPTPSCALGVASTDHAAQFGRTAPSLERRRLLVHGTDH